jgi:hypothetical protein
MRAAAPRRHGAPSGAGGGLRAVHLVGLAAALTGLTALGLALKLASFDGGAAGVGAPLRVYAAGGGGSSGGGRARPRALEAALAAAAPAPGAGGANPAFRSARSPDGGGAPAPPASAWGYRFRVVSAPTPSPLPLILNTRGCECAAGWVPPPPGAPPAAASVCSCGGVACAPHVDPRFLTDAVGQDACSLRRATGFTCTARCQAPEEGKPAVLWFAGGCGGAGQGPCDPLVVPASATASPTGPPLPPVAVPATTWAPDDVYDFRGGGCELLDGREQCYMEDGQGRELCPPSVTLDLMTRGPAEYPQCGPSQAHAFYCTIICQEGNPTVRWGVHNIEECYKPENRGNCPPRPTGAPPPRARARARVRTPSR